MHKRLGESFPVPRERVLADVVAGLSQPRKRLSGKYLWDETGSEIFDRICDTQDYYLTRAETALLKAAAPEIAARIGPRASLVEYGSGASRKVRLLLDALPEPALYVAIDISADYLARAAARIAQAYPGLAVHPLVADYTHAIALPDEARAPILGFFPGSTIGNFPPEEVVAFLARIRETLGGGRLLIGHDPNRDEARLARAYGEADGLMPALHLNMLRHLARSLGVAIDPADFRHEIRIARDPFRVEAHLVALRPVTIALRDRRFALAAGESLHTDSSYKMTVEDFLRLAAAAGFAPERSWHDAEGLYALHLLRPE